MGPGVIQHPAAGGQGALLPGAVVRHVGKGDAEGRQLGAELLDLPLAGRARLIGVRMIHRVWDGVQQLTAVLLRAQGRVEGDHVSVPLFRPVVVDEPVSDGPGRIGEERAPCTGIA